MADEIIVKVRSEGVEDFTKGLKKAGVTVEKTGKKVEEAEGKMSKSFKKIGAVVGAAFATQQLIQFGKELTKLAIELDATEAKYKKVFGESSKTVENFAKKNAIALGLTVSEYKRAAAAAGDLLIPIGFQRAEAAKLSSGLVNLSGALAAWSGGQFKATEVSEILTKALLGEREQLKTLGINIMEADVSARLLEKGQKKLTGTMLAQAKATATLELIYEKSTDAQNAFADGTTTLAEQQLVLQANFKQIAESIAKFFIPVVSNATQIAIDLANVFKRTSDESEDLAESWKEQNAAINDTEKALKPLLARYDDLKNKSSLSKVEQDELKVVINDIADIVPEAAVGFDEYGDALDINRTAVDRNVASQRLLAGALNQEAVKQAQERLEELTVELNRNRSNIEKNNTAQSNINEKYGESSDLISILSKANELLGGSSKDAADNIAETNNEIAKTLIVLQSLGQVMTPEQIKIIDDYYSALSGDSSGGGKGVSDEVTKMKFKFNDFLGGVDSGLSDNISLTEAWIVELQSLGVEADTLTGIIIDGLNKSKAAFAETWGENKLEMSGYYALKGKKASDDENTQLDANEKAIAGIEAISQIQQASSEIVATVFNRQLAALEEKNKKGLISDKEYEKEKAKILTKQAKAEKAQSIFNIGLSIASGIAKAVAQSPLTGGLPFTAIVAAIGAIQLATAIAQPIPKFAKGTKGSSTAPAGFAWVGEEGPELMQMKGGEKIVTNGDSEEIMRILAGYSIPVQFKRTEDELYKPMRTIKDLQRGSKGIDWNPLLDSNYKGMKYHGRKLDRLHQDLVMLNNNLGRKMTAN